MKIGLSTLTCAVNLQASARWHNARLWSTTHVVVSDATRPQKTPMASPPSATAKNAATPVTTLAAVMLEVPAAANWLSTLYSTCPWYLLSNERRGLCYRTTVTASLSSDSPNTVM